MNSLFKYLYYFKSVIKMTKPLFIKPDNASQLVIGNSTDSEQCAALAINSDKGILLPRLTQLKIDALNHIKEGLQVYNLDTKKVQVYNGTGWIELGVTSVSGEPSLSDMTTVYINAKT